MIAIRSFGYNVEAQVNFAGRESDHKKQRLAVRPVVIKSNVYYFESLSMRSCVIPVDENPPSCIRFCMVIILVKSENIMVM